ncbi:hypothetical protein BT96DRAFT_919767 [Gymnopus androsaceus JB14]|uniref:Serine hydrolase domain-containing protein n=1 Tax=Gymnopus androsaceus JB14 TaxID=1447944 RepID=A0A6A4HQM8_9AGAR|nr:hypothetical protein BT96DRAFT_919767 [Gymnopus androsaceus JB14]
MASTTLKRVLVLHGYAQNAYIFTKRLSAIRKQCKSTVEFIFVDAPHVLQPEDLFDNQSTEPEANSDPLKDPNAVVRGWWKSVEPSVGLEESLVFMRDFLKKAAEEGKGFDGFFGFSQGAAMAAILTALLETPSRYPNFIIEWQNPASTGILLRLRCRIYPYVSSRYLDYLSDLWLHNPDTPHLRPDRLYYSVCQRQNNTGNAPGKNRDTRWRSFCAFKAPWRKFIASWLNDPLDVSIPSPEAAAITSDPSTPADSRSATPAS